MKVTCKLKEARRSGFSTPRIYSNGWLAARNGRTDQNANRYSLGHFRLDG